MTRVVKEKYERYSEEATARRRESAKLRVAEWRRANPEKYLAQRKAWYERTVERRREYANQFYRANRERWKGLSRKYLMKNTYGITVEVFDKILESQGGKCAICRGINKADKQMHLDHDHSTGKIRGVLCQRCNHGLGHFRDNIQYLENAAKYLKRGDLLPTT